MENSETALYLKRITQIHDFYNDEIFTEIRDFYSAPSFWQIMKIARGENKHSEFLSYYLNPNNNHTVRDIFLTKFLQLIAHRGVEQGKMVNCSILHNLVLGEEVKVTNQTFREVSFNDNNKGRFDIYIEGIIKSVEEQSRPFVLVVENKICSKEGKNQTIKYKKHLERMLPGYEHICVYLSPNANAKTSSKDFIIITYQDILTDILEPILKTVNLGESDRSRLNDYIKCLSVPALEETTKSKIKSILAMSEKEMKLLIDFWDKNVDLIKACCQAIANSDDSSFSDEDKEVARSVVKTSLQRDNSKYQLGESGKPVGRGEIVASFIEKWSKKHLQNLKNKEDIIAELIKEFPASLRGGSNNKEEIVYKERPKQSRAERNYRKIKVAGQDIYVATNIWTRERFDLFLNKAKELGQGDNDLNIIKSPN